MNKLSTDLQLQVKYHVSCMTFLLGRYFELCCLDLHYQSSRVYVDHLVASFPSFADRRREDGAIFPFAWSCSLAHAVCAAKLAERRPFHCKLTRAGGRSTGGSVKGLKETKT